MSKQSTRNKERSQKYREIAIEYLKGGKTMHKVCTEFEEKTPFFINRSTVWRYIRKLREEKIKENLTN